MSKLEVIKFEKRNMVSAILKTRIPEVDFEREDIGELIEIAKNLRETLFDLYSQNRAIGLAAPQVGIAKRMFAIVFPFGIGVYVNPKIVKASKEHVLVTEGCLSLPSTYFLKVRRPKWVIFKATEITPFGQIIHDIELNLKKLPQIFTSAVCHEIDHLNGILLGGKV